MANHLQTKKRIRQTVRRAAHNRDFRSAMRTYVKRVRSYIDSGEADSARQALGVAVKQLDKAVTNGLLHRKTASRAISRLTRAVQKIA